MALAEDTEVRAECAAGSILVTGATGFIGQHLVRALLTDGRKVTVLSRDPERAQALFGPQVTAIRTTAEIGVHSRIDAIVNLAGASIAASPWTTRRRRRLLDSRLEVTRAVVELCSTLAARPVALINASAVGFYGVRDASPVDESSAGQDCFQSMLCQRWESAAMRATPGTRVVCLRFGVVLGSDGGALPPLVRAARLLGGLRLGDGKQGFPWIHIYDAVALIKFALSNPVQGAVNAVSPDVVTQAEFQRVLANALHRPSWLRVPALLLRALLGEMAQLLVDGQFVQPKRALDLGFAFRYGPLDDAIGSLLGSHRPAP